MDVKLTPGYYEWHLEIDGKRYWTFSDYLGEAIADAEIEYGHNLSYSELRELCRGELETISFAIRDGLQEDWNSLGQTPLTKEQEDEAAEAMARTLAAHFGIGKIRHWLVPVTVSKTVMVPVLAETLFDAEEKARKHVSAEEQVPCAQDLKTACRFRTRKVDEDAKGLYGGYRHEEFIS